MGIIVITEKPGIPTLSANTIVSIPQPNRLKWSPDLGFTEVALVLLSCIIMNTEAPGIPTDSVYPLICFSWNNDAHAHTNSPMPAKILRTKKLYKKKELLPFHRFCPDLPLLPVIEAYEIVEWRWSMMWTLVYSDPSWARRVARPTKGKWKISQENRSPKPATTNLLWMNENRLHLLVISLYLFQL